MAQLVPKPIAPVRSFEDGPGYYPYAVAVFPDRRRMATGSDEKMIRLWDMKEGVVLKRMQWQAASNGHIVALAVSPDGKLITSGDSKGDLIPWDVDVGESLTKVINAHSNISSLDFSPDGSMLAVTGSSSSYDSLGRAKLWCTKSWELLGEPITCNARGHCVRFSPSGELLAIATESDIQIYNPTTRQCVANFKAHAGWNKSLAWTPDGARLFSAGNRTDPTIREWDTSTWEQVGDPWKGHLDAINAISLNSDGTLLASASDDYRVRLWRVSEQRTIIGFKHSNKVYCVTFSDDKHILSGGPGVDGRILEWSVPEDSLPEGGPKNGPQDGPKNGPQDGPHEQAKYQAQAYSDFKVFTINSTARNACIAGDLPTAEKVLGLEIKADVNNYTSYANRAFVMARKRAWDHALLDAVKSVSIQPSFVGHISKGIALCGKRQVWAASTAFDLASMYMNGDLKTSHFLFLVKTIALFNANEHEVAMLRVGELAVSPDVDPLVCPIVEAYLRVQLGKLALDGTRHNEAVDHFTLAVNASASFYNLPIHSTYEEFVVLFGWDLKSLWQTANQQRCHALFRAGRIGAAIESYQSMMDKSDETTRASLRAWFSALK